MVVGHPPALLTSGIFSGMELTALIVGNVFVLSPERKIKNKNQHIYCLKKKSLAMWSCVTGEG